MNKWWASELSKACGYSVKLPTNKHFSLTGSRGNVEIRLSASAVCRNMQDDAAAFEGWTLALLTWGKAGKVTLTWDPPQDQHDAHYQRFLYRVEKFSALAPASEFAVSQPAHVWSTMHAGKKLVLNVAQGNDTRTPQANSEAALEKAIATAGTPENARLRKLGMMGEVDRQFPVGLFADKVSKTSAIFPRGKSAVDLIVLEADASLHIVELKLRDNRKVGAVSELFFYTCVLDDLRNRNFSATRTPGPRARLGPRHVETATALHGLILMEGGGPTPAVHPLVASHVLNHLSSWGAIQYSHGVL